MEEPGHPAANAESEHHVTELTYRGVGENLLDVRHDDGDRGRHEQGDAARVGDYQQGFGRKNWKRATDQIDARCHHGCGMD